MATTKTKKTTTSSANNNENPKSSERIIPKDIDPSDYVSVRNGFQGKLVYISKRTKEKFVWDNFGDVQEIELRELRNVKSSAKRFFEDNWFMFDEEDMWVIDYLGVSKYYANAIPLEKFDEVFTMSSDKIGEIISKLSKGQANSLAYRARQKVLNGDIDSRKMISALEEALGIDLIEK